MKSFIFLPKGCGNGEWVLRSSRKEKALKEKKKSKIFIVIGGRLFLSPDSQVESFPLNTLGLLTSPNSTPMKAEQTISLVAAFMSHRFSIR